MQNEIITERLYLNPLTLDDYEFIIRLVNSSGWIEFIGDRNVHGKYEAIGYIKNIMDTQDLFYWVARLKDEHIPIGVISFIKRSYLENFDIGFAFLPEFNGKGYAYEASGEILSTMGKDAGYYPILATTLPCNVKSIRLLKKLGLHFEKEIEVGNERLNVYSNSVG